MIIKIDGIDGCGKTTLINSLVERFGQNTAVSISEFGADADVSIPVHGALAPISKVIRDIALDTSAQLDDVERQLLMSFISRRSNRVVIPKLNSNYQYVFVDRSNLSNHAYAGALSDKFADLFKLSTDPVDQYDLLIWLDTPIDTCMDRLSKKRKDAVEEKGQTYFLSVQDKYRKLVKKMSDNGTTITRLNGSGTLNEITDEAEKLIRNI